jgi:hypothetical protein
MSGSGSVQSLSCTGFWGPSTTLSPNALMNKAIARATRAACRCPIGLIWMISPSMSSTRSPGKDAGLAHPVTFVHSEPFLDDFRRHKRTFPTSILPKAWQSSVAGSRFNAESALPRLFLALTSKEPPDTSVRCDLIYSAPPPLASERPHLRVRGASLDLPTFLHLSQD